MYMLWLARESIDHTNHFFPHFPYSAIIVLNESVTRYAYFES